MIMYILLKSIPSCAILVHILKLFTPCITMIINLYDYDPCIIIFVLYYMSVVYVACILYILALVEWS